MSLDLAAQVTAIDRFGQHADSTTLVVLKPGRVGAGSGYPVASAGSSHSDQGQGSRWSTRRLNDLCGWTRYTFGADATGIPAPPWRLPLSRPAQGASRGEDRRRHWAVDLSSVVLFGVNTDWPYL